MADVDDVLAEAAAWHREGRRVAIATVVSTWGSSPRPVGSQLAVDDHGRFAGSVSGGCVESAVVQAAQEVINGGRSRLLEFGISNQMAWEVGLACGGRVQVYVERVAHWLLEAVLAARAAGAPVAVVMHLDSGEQAILFAEGGEQGELVLAEEIIRDVRRAIAADRSQSLDTPAGRLFICVFTPPPRLVIVGAVHIAEPLTVIGQLAGYAVTIIDPRQAFAARDRFAGVTMASGWPDDALVRIEPDERTAVVTLTHDPKLDDAALAVALRSPAFYIGALGSRKSQAARQDRLAKLGFSEGERARVCGPVGLAIGAETPAEIAIAIMAEITQKRRSGRSA